MLNLTPYQCHLARAALKWTYDDVKRLTGFDRCRINRFEAGLPIRERDVVTATLRRLFEDAGVRFGRDSIGYPEQWTYEL